jgi:adenylate cyclase class IV
MIELELKAVVPDLIEARHRAERGGARLAFGGRLEDRRYDWPDLRLAAQDHVLRLRIYRDETGEVKSASLDWKGPTGIDGGYKQREEIDSDIGRDPENVERLARIFDRLGFVVSMQIDRDIWQYDLAGAVVRFERYPRMDDLVEIEGETAAIENAIAILGIPREACTAERLPDFVRRFEQRTGRRAALSNAELSGDVRYDVSNA